MKKIFAFLAGAALLAVSCAKEPEPVAAPELAATPASLSFVAASPAAQSVTITSNAEWAASAADSWVTVSPKSGNGNGTLTVTAADNVAEPGAAAPARSSSVTVTIEGKKVAVQVSQEAETVVFAVEGTPTDVPATGASVSVKVEANSTYTYTSSADWCKLADGAATKAVKTDNLKFVVAENTTYEARTATITFTSAAGSSKTVTVKQAAAEKPAGKDIASAADLAEFAAALEKGDISAFDPDKDNVVKLVADIDAGTLNAPLDTLPETIVFDGGTHQIKYVIANESATALNLGLFSAVEGTVRNLKVAGSVTESTPASSLTFHIGGVAGYVGAKGLIDGCTSSVNLLATTQNTHHIGGIAGYTAAGAVVNACINEGEVKMSIPELGTANASQLGGMVGHVEGSGSIENCENKGTITYEGTGTPRMAGIVGYVNNLVKVTIKDTKNSGNIVWNEGNYAKTSWSYIGGFTGYNGTPTNGGELTYENCTNTGNLTCNITEAYSRVRIGGIMAHGGSTTAANQITYNLKNCSNSGKMTITTATADRTIAGGIVGFAETNATVNVDGCTFSGTIESLGGGKVGGIVGGTCNAASTFKNITITKEALLTSEKGFKAASFGIIGGANTAYTTAVTGKVAGTIVDGEKTWKVNKNNYTNHLFGVALGEGASVEGVTCDEDGEADPGAEPEKPAVLPFTETFSNNDWTSTTGDGSDKLTDTQLKQFKDITDVYWARTNVGGIKLGTSSKIGTLTTKDLDLSKDFYVRIKAAAYSASEGKLCVAVGDTVRTFDLLPAGNKVIEEYVANFKATELKNVKFYTSEKRAYLVSIQIDYGHMDPPAVKYIASVSDLAALIASADALAAATTTYKISADIDLGGVTIPAAAGPLAATIDGQGHAIKNAKVTAPIFAKNTGVIKNLVIDSTIEYVVPETVAGDIAVLVAENEGTVSGCTNKAAIAITANPAASYIGGLVARSSGLIDNCTNEANISINAASATGVISMGGVVALASGNAGVVTVKDSKNSGKVSAVYSGTPKNGYIGGVVGSTVVNKEANKVMQGVISGCSNSGEVVYTINVPNSGTYSDVGGVAGYIEGVVKSCSNTGKVGILNPEKEDASAVCTRPGIGGVVACVEGSVEDCTNSGAVTITGSFSAGTAGNAGAGGSSNPVIGGVAGCVGTAARDESGTFKNCSNTGTVTVQTVQKVKGSTQARIGGVVGCVSVPVTNCHNEGALDVKALARYNVVGGVAGLVFNNITDCWNDAPISVDGRKDFASKFAAADYIGAQYYIGGVYGESYVTAINYTNVENKAKGTITVKDCINKVAYSYVGGIGGGYASTGTGCAINGATNSAEIVVDQIAATIVAGVAGGFNGDITNAKNTANVTVKNINGDDGKEGEIGGVVGYLNGALTGCTSQGTFTLETSAETTYMGGLVGGFGSVDKLFSNSEVNCTLAPAANTVKGSVIGRFRNAPADGATPNVVTLGAEGAPVTINAANSALAVCGFANGHTVTEANVVKK